MANVNTKGLNLSITLDTSGFDKAMEKYMTFQKRLPADVINGKLYFIARNATMTTKAADKSGIETELRGPSRDYPDVPLAAIIVNTQLKAKGKKGLTGEKMATAMDKLIKKRKASVNFVRAGWKNAIKLLEAYMRAKGELNFVRRWQSSAPVDSATMKKKKFEYLGKATPAMVERVGRVWGEIQNDVHGKDGESNLAHLEQVKQDGLQKAVDKEVRSMYIYMERKLNPVHREFNQKQGF